MSGSRLVGGERLTRGHRLLRRTPRARPARVRSAVRREVVGACPRGGRRWARARRSPSAIRSAISAICGRSPIASMKNSTPGPSPAGGWATYASAGPSGTGISIRLRFMEKQACSTLTPSHPPVGEPGSRYGRTGACRGVAGRGLTHKIRGLPSRGCLLGLSDSCGRPRCLPSVRVLGSTCTHDRSRRRRSMASRASCSRRRLTPSHEHDPVLGRRRCRVRWRWPTRPVRPGSGCTGR